MNDFYLDAAEKYNEISAPAQKAMWTAGKACEAHSEKQPPSRAAAAAAGASKWKEADSEEGRGGAGREMYCTWIFFFKTSQKVPH